MKKTITTIILSVVLVSLAGAQDRQFKLSKKTGTININTAGVHIEGYDGNEILFSAPALKNEDKDERAAGLRLVNGSGLTDNTGMNLSVRENGTAVDVDFVGKKDNEAVTIKVPNTMAIKVITTNIMNASWPVDIKDFKGALEVSTMYNTISLNNITGPVTAKTIYGELTATFATAVKGPVSLVALYKFVDITIPAGLKANLNVSSQNGSIYAADGLDIKKEPLKAKSSDGTDISGLNEHGRASEIKGTLNGGGIDLILKTSYGKIYLRKS